MYRVCWIALILLLLAGRGAVEAQIYTLPRTNAAVGDFFGADVALDGDRVLVGATGVSTCGENSGAAYVYDREPASGRWSLSATLSASDCSEGMFFGRSLAIDGSTAVVSAYRNTTSTVAPNAVYVFELDSLSGEWRQTARLIGDLSVSEGPFGADVGADRGRILVTSAGDLAEGAFGGAAYVYEKGERSGWRQTARLTASRDTRYGILGGAAAIDGDRIVVSASKYFSGGRGSVYVFDYNRSTQQWAEAARLSGFEDFFIATAVSQDRIVVGESKAGRESEGRVTIAERGSDGKWSKSAVLQPTHPFELGAFGSNVALEGDRVLAVGYDEQLQFEFNIDRVVYVFEYERPKARRGSASDSTVSAEALAGDDDSGQRRRGTWRQKHIIDVGSVYFGSSVALDAGVAAIGQASDDAPGAVVIVQLH